MLTLEPTPDLHCQGVSFAVTDADALARAVALVMIQEYVLARRILLGGTTESTDTDFDADEIDDIVARRLKPENVYHRDGLLFQLIMWLAAHLDLPSADLVALPHAQAAAKGQDSIIVHRANGAVIALSICEDKATAEPRDTVRDEVWPVIQEYERGGRRDELRSNIISTLGLGGVPVEEATRLIRGISWEGKRRYRVRLALEGNRTKDLFKGFDEVVSGVVERRRGETAQLPRLRAWMDDFAVKVESELLTFVRRT